VIFASYLLFGALGVLARQRTARGAASGARAADRHHVALRLFGAAVAAAVLALAVAVGSRTSVTQIGVIVVMAGAQGAIIFAAGLVFWDGMLGFALRTAGWGLMCISLLVPSTVTLGLPALALLVPTLVIARAGRDQRTPSTARKRGTAA
jgi:hypothetical protein